MIDELIKNAMKSRNKVELRAYQNLKAEIQKFKTAKNAKPYDEAAELAIISKYCKSLEDAIKQFSEARRDDLVAEYISELEVLKKLIYEPPSTQEIYSELINWQIKMAFENDWPMELDRPIIPKKEVGMCFKHMKAKFPSINSKKLSKIIQEYVV